MYKILYEKPPRELNAGEIRVLKNKETTSLSTQEKQRLSSFRKMENKKRASKKKNKAKKMKQSQKKQRRRNREFDE